MDHLSTSEARRQFAELVNRVCYGHERVVIGRRGHELAAVVSIQDLRLLERLADQLEDQLDSEDAQRVLADERDELVPWDRVKRELGAGPLPGRREAKRATRARRPAPARAGTHRRRARRAR